MSRCQHETGSKKLVLTKSEHIKLSLPAATSDVDREKYWPRDAATHKAYHHDYLQEAKEEVAIERVVLQNVGIWNLHDANSA